MTTTKKTIAITITLLAIIYLIKPQPTKLLPTTPNSTLSSTENTHLNKEISPKPLDNNAAQNDTSVLVEQTDNTDKWLEKSGYAIMLTYLPSGHDDLKSIGLDSSSDYAFYDTNTLRQLAQQGDAEAAFRYALDPNTTPKEAIDYFRSSLINGHYIAATFQIAMRYDDINLSTRDETLLERLTNNPGTALNTQDQAYLDWLFTGQLLNDPFSIQLLHNGLLRALSDQQQVELLMSAQNNLEAINALRTERGNKPLERMENTDRIANLFSL